MFEPRLEVLPPAQQRLWRELDGTPHDFVLYGGTALALRLGHRQSADFDFFSSARVDSTWLLREVPYLRGAETLQRSTDTLTCLVDRGDPVRVSFLGGLASRRVADPDTLATPAVTVASLLDLAAPREVCRRLRDAAAAVDPLHLPRFEPLAGVASGA